MVYAIGLESEYFNGMRVVKTRPSRDLKRIAEETGGGYFELLKTADLARHFRGSSRSCEVTISSDLLPLPWTASCTNSRCGWPNQG